MRQLPFASAFSYFLNGLRRRLYIAGASEKSKGSTEMLSLPFGESALRRVKPKAYLAYASYRPSFYRGKIHFITTQTKSFFPEDPAAVWRSLAGELEVEVIPGNHLIFSPQNLRVWLQYSLATSSKLLAGMLMSACTRGNQRSSRGIMRVHRKTSTVKVRAGTGTRR